MALCKMLASLLAVLIMVMLLATYLLGRSGSSTRWSCARWYSHLEAALLVNDEIIFELQGTLFSESGSAPLSMVVQYDIRYLSSGTWEERRYCQGWSSSEVLSKIHRVILMQSWLEAFALFQGRIRLEPVNISLSIAEDIGEFPPDPELECAIRRLTGWVS